jgi:hypothetical protein
MEAAIAASSHPLYPEPGCRHQDRDVAVIGTRATEPFRGSVQPTAYLDNGWSVLCIGWPAARVLAARALPTPFGTEGRPPAPVGGARPSSAFRCTTDSRAWVDFCLLSRLAEAEVHSGLNSAEETAISAKSEPRRSGARVQRV